MVSFHSSSDGSIDQDTSIPHSRTWLAFCFAPDQSNGVPTALIQEQSGWYSFQQPKKSGWNVYYKSPMVLRLSPNS